MPDSSSPSTVSPVSSQISTFVTITSTSGVIVTLGPSSTEMQMPPSQPTYYPGTQWLPTTLITEAPPMTTAPTLTQTSLTPTATGAPLPNVIAPSGGIPTIPPDSTLVQVGFTYALNYPFIVKNPLAVAQIFDYLPKGISYGLGLSIDQTIMQSIQPYETAGEKFIVSVAMMYIPTDLVNTLLLGLHTPSSAFYDNPDPSVNGLMGLIDPTIPLVASTDDDGSPGNSGDDSSGGSSGDSSGSNGNGDSNSDSGTSNQSTVLSGSLDVSDSPAKSSKQVIGIAVGAVAGVVVYGCLLFFLARKYRKRKQRQLSSPNMRQISPPMPYMAPASGSPYSYVTPSGSGGSGGAGGAPGSGGRLGHSPTSSTRRNINASRQSRISGSHGSSSGGYVSARNQPISVPVTSENSLGWF
ncbi:hypothetical protein POJ06DRAFT_235987 [Lipomyces tetrasporus]|uniref:Signaling mucin MSB2 n=1 Tax=Lipomyces tetrasporus TaxID=54092 RepID=A0AAD7QX07_9ASCO|nr:uncharacterized protein POJ06DRAFT_235987 [Lipomyces tetrasporus]KAJ8103047.1 hypothetical protein POJ06DRAFT_235987 [Lipomyces tetrasporus]